MINLMRMISGYQNYAVCPSIDKLKYDTIFLQQAAITNNQFTISSEVINGRCSIHQGC
jgi:hypothetical protein